MLSYPYKHFLLVLLLCIGVGSPASASLDEDYLRENAALWAEAIYALYAAEEFAAVYSHMAPEIQKMVTEEVYVQHQENHFRRHRLRISDVTAQKVIPDPKLPPTLQEPLAAGDYDGVVSVSMEYAASFLVLGLRHTETLNKDVFFAWKRRDGDSVRWYLLWDPSSLEEDAPDGEG